MESIYEINKDTCALIPKGENTTEVIEIGKRFIINTSTLELLKKSCEYYGSTLEGRIKGSENQLGMRYKLPLIIEGSNEIIIFPTSSRENESCCWIALNHIKDYQKVDNNSLITFLNQEQYLFPISFTSLENQIFRATKLLLVSRTRRKKEKIS